MECLLEDRGTHSAMEQYISGAGKHANSEDLAQAVTDYWSPKPLEDLGSPVLANQELTSCTARERFHRMGYC